MDQVVTFDDILNDVLVMIFEYLDLNNIRNASLVCKNWNNVIETTNIIWKNILPKCAGFSPPKSKKDFKKLYTKCLIVGKEMWYPDPYKIVTIRDDLVHYYNQLRFFWKRPKHDSFRLYIRLNPTYDLTRNDTKSADPEILELFDTIMKRFKHGQEYDYGSYITSVEDAIKYSVNFNSDIVVQVIYCSKFNVAQLPGF